jgi:hypothetical protein
MPERSRLFADPSWLNVRIPIFPMFLPFWPDAFDRTLLAGRFDAYEKVGRRDFELVDLPEADFAVLPAAWENVVSVSSAREKAFELAERVRAAGKKLLVFFWSDSEEKVPLPNSVVYRTSLSGSTRGANEFAMPAWSEDFVEAHLGSRLPFREKSDLPIVGFCGFAGYWAPRGSPLTMHVGAFGRRIKHRTFQPTVRERALRALSKSDGVATNFIIRDRFLAGAEHASDDYRARVRQEFVQNMVESDFVICARGGGNFSYRFYETLSCGRVPLFVNTDCVLPFDDEIKWRDVCVWIEESEIPVIGQRVCAAYDDMDDAGFRDRQRLCRHLWDNWISPQSFFGRIRENKLLMAES